MEYIVKEGDTLWSICKDELGDPKVWQRVFFANKKTIGAAQAARGIKTLTPDLIFPGTVLEICPKPPNNTLHPNHSETAQERPASPASGAISKDAS